WELLLASCVLRRCSDYSREVIHRGCFLVFFFQAEDGIRDFHVTGVQTCALPICFVSLEAAVERLGDAEHWVLLCAAPHGASAEVIARILDAADAAGVRITAVDTSADFRFADPEAYAKVYGHPHGAPARLAEFSCALPENAKSIETPHAAHAGCFAPSMLLGIGPVVAPDLGEPEISVSAITGSTGAGRTPKDTTHHPMRHNNLFGYQALKHRHAPEVRALVEAATGRPIRLSFVPHSGPFARGIYATIFARLKIGRAHV